MQLVQPAWLALLLTPVLVYLAVRVFHHFVGFVAQRRLDEKSEKKYWVMLDGQDHECPEWKLAGMRKTVLEYGELNLRQTVNIVGALIRFAAVCAVVVPVAVFWIVLLSPAGLATEMVHDPEKALGLFKSAAIGITFVTAMYFAISFKAAHKVLGIKFLLADELDDALRRHFRASPRAEVLVVQADKRRPEDFNDQMIVNGKLGGKK